jgi:hypothetical protein
LNAPQPTALARTSGLLRAHWPLLLAPLVTFVVVRWRIAQVGGPLMSPDAWKYFELSKHPSTGLGGWSPIGLPLFTYLLSPFGVEIAGVCALLAALRIAAVQAILTRYLSRRWAIAACLLFIGPVWILLGVTYWSETLFGLCLFLLAWVFTGRSLLWLFPFTLALCFTRIAGLFFVPALLLGVYVVTKDWRQRGVGAVAVLLAALTANTISTGNPLRASKDQTACGMRLVSLNDFDFCDVPLVAPLCAMDTQRQFLGHPLSNSYNAMAWAHYGGNSPFKRFADTYGDQVTCAAASEAFRHVVFTHPFGYAWVVAKRVWASFGPFDATEISPGACPTPLCRQKSGEVEQGLQDWKWTQYGAQLLLVFVLGALAIRRQTRTPLVMFLVAAALAHAGGIAVLNPFPALRYYAIHQALILLAAVVVATKVRA